MPIDIRTYATHLLQASSLIMLVSSAPAYPPSHPHLQAATSTPASTNCGSFDPQAAYPSLPPASGPDVDNDAPIHLYLQTTRGVVDLGGCLYQLDRPLEIGIGTGEQADLLFELPDANAGPQVFVTDPGGLLESFEIHGSSFSYALNDDTERGFELAPLNQAAPTVPVVVTKPIDDDPDPR